ncbi:MAG: hypothetical protein GY746_06225 [Gammaproteobacteria bacterium]|nr:hypothetical protein [Gammaproteobacteria bacterium]
MARAKEPLIDEIKNGMGIIEFCHKGGMDQFYYRYLDYIDTSSFLLVGFVDEMQSFYKGAEHIMGLRKGNLVFCSPKRVNKVKDSVSIKELTMIQKFLSNEIQYYQDVRRIWQAN